MGNEVKKTDSPSPAKVEPNEYQKLQEEAKKLGIEPKGLSKQPLLPNESAWHEVNNSSMAVLKYHDLTKHSDPEKQLLNFLQSAFNAGSSLAHCKANQ